MMRLLLLLLVCSVSSMLSAQSHKVLSELQYWIDNGELTKGTFISNDTTFVIDATTTSEGLHTLNYRVKDSEGMYSPLHTWIFLRKGKEPDVIENSISHIEYWLDEDIEHKQIQTAEDNAVTFFIGASSLSSGLHKLTCYVSDTYGKNSPAEVWIFIKPERQETSSKKITWLKYWWNDHTDKAIKENVTNDSTEYTFFKKLIVPDYAQTDTTNCTARFYYVVGDDQGYVSILEYADVEYSDGIAPISIIEADKEQTEDNVTLNWYITSRQVKDFNIYYSEDDQPFVLWLSNTTKTSAMFKGQIGKNYRFTVTARDKFNNREKLDESKCVKVTFTKNNDSEL